MANISINIEDYISEEEIKQEIKQTIRDTVEYNLDYSKRIKDDILDFWHLCIAEILKELYNDDQDFKDRIREMVTKFFDEENYRLYSAMFASDYDKYNSDRYTEKIGDITLKAIFEEEETKNKIRSALSDVLEKKLYEDNTLQETIGDSIAYYIAEGINKIHGR